MIWKVVERSILLWEFGLIRSLNVLGLIRCVFVVFMIV